jgi:hypothetical protein
MKNLLLNILKIGLLTVCDCTGNNFKEEQQKCLSYEQKTENKKKYAYRIIDSNTDFFCFALCLAILFLYACDGSGTSDRENIGNGSVSFAIKWVDNSSVSNYKSVLLHSEDVCVNHGIELISADIFDADNAVVTSDSWPCSDHQGTLDEIPAGTRYKLVVEGADVSGDVNWRGEVPDITVAAGVITDVGTVSMIYIGDDKISPQVVSIDPVDGEVCTPVYAVITAVFSESMFAASVNESSFFLKIGTNTVNGSVTYEPSTKAAIFTPTKYLSMSELYTATLTTGAKDMAGNPITKEISWSFTTTEVCDFDMDCDVDGFDLLTFTSAYEAESPDADLNDDGEINNADVKAFSGAFGNLPMQKYKRND